MQGHKVQAPKDTKCMKMLSTSELSQALLHSIPNDYKYVLMYASAWVYNRVSVQMDWACEQVVNMLTVVS